MTLASQVDALAAVLGSDRRSDRAQLAQLAAPPAIRTEHPPLTDAGTTTAPYLLGDTLWYASPIGIYRVRDGARLWISGTMAANPPGRGTTIVSPAGNDYIVNPDEAKVLSPESDPDSTAGTAGANGATYVLPENLAGPETATLAYVDTQTTTLSDAIGVLAAHRVAPFPTLLDASGQLDPALVSAIEGGAVTHVLVASHRPPSAYPDSAPRGGAIYVVGDTAGSPDGHVVRNVGDSHSLTLQIENKTLYSACWGVTGTSGQLEQDACQAMADYAASIATAGARATVIFDGPAIGISNLHIEGNINVWMAPGAGFSGRHNAAGFDDSLPYLTIGSYGFQTTRADHRGIGVSSLYHAGIARRGLIGVRIVNHEHSEIVFGKTSGCASLIQLCGSGLGGRFGYNRVTGGQLTYGRHLLTLLSMAGGDVHQYAGWTNELTWRSGSFSASSSMDKEGSVYGITFAHEANAYKDANCNAFERIAFEIGKSDSNYSYPSGQSFAQYQRFCAGGREYEVQVAKTLPATAPTHTSGTVDDMLYIGDYRRTPLLFEGTGGEVTIRAARWEGGYGEAAIAHFVDVDNNTRAGNATSIDFSQIVNRFLPENYAGFDINFTPPEQAFLPSGEVHVTSRALRPLDRVSLKRLHESAIYSTENAAWHSHRFPFLSYNASGPRIQAVGQALFNPAQAPILHRDSIRTTTVYGSLGVFIDLAASSHVQIDLGGARLGSPGLAYLWALDDAFATIAQPATTATELAVGGDSTLGFFTVANALRVSLASNGAIRVGRKPGSTVRYLLIGFVTNRTNDISLSVLPYSADAANKSIQIGTPDQRVHPLNTARASNGAPAYGFFRQAGEIISSVAAADARTWIVDAPGIAAPPWAPATAVSKGQLVTSAGRTYAAIADGTTGATAPTHASGTASDDAVQWEYLDVVPVITERV